MTITITFEVLDAGTNPADQRYRHHAAAHCQRNEQVAWETDLPDDQNGTHR